MNKIEIIEYNCLLKYFCISAIDRESKNIYNSEVRYLYNKFKIPKRLILIDAEEYIKENSCLYDINNCILKRHKSDILSFPFFNVNNKFLDNVNFSRKHEKINFEKIEISRLKKKINKIKRNI